MGAAVTDQPHPRRAHPLGRRVTGALDRFAGAIGDLSRAAELLSAETGDLARVLAAAGHHGMAAQAIQVQRDLQSMAQAICDAAGRLDVRSGAAAAGPRGAG